MSWTQEQKNEIFDTHWQGYETNCPTDNALLEVQIQKFLGGSYVMVARCPRCGEDMEMGPEQDPKRPQFRAWTEAEKAKIVDTHFANMYNHCPVCGARFECQASRSLGSKVTHVSCRCPRCGNSHSHQQVG